MTKSLFDLPYRSETECMERALSFHGRKPDILLSLGGEAFSVYPMKDGMIANVISTSKCAAGTGEFIVQQLQRMGLSLEQGLEESLQGRLVQVASLVASDLLQTNLPSRDKWFWKSKIALAALDPLKDAERLLDYRAQKACAGSRRNLW